MSEGIKTEFLALVISDIYTGTMANCILLASVKFIFQPKDGYFSNTSGAPNKKHVSFRLDESKDWLPMMHRKTALQTSGWFPEIWVKVVVSKDWWTNVHLHILS